MQQPMFKYGYSVIVVLVHTSHLDLSLIRSFGFDIFVPHHEG
jgi:hypothetical protein